MNMTRDAAIAWLERAIEETEQVWDRCSLTLQAELDEQREVFRWALAALRAEGREQEEEDEARAEAAEGECTV